MAISASPPLSQWVVKIGQAVKCVLFWSFFLPHDCDKYKSVAKWRAVLARPCQPFTASWPDPIDQSSTGVFGFSRLNYFLFVFLFWGGDPAWGLSLEHWTVWHLSATTTSRMRVSFWLRCWDFLRAQVHGPSYTVRKCTKIFYLWI